MIIHFWGDSVRSFFPVSARPQYAILGTGILGQIASFERRLRGRAPSSGDGSNAPRPAVSVPHLAGTGYMG